MTKIHFPVLVEFFFTQKKFLPENFQKILPENFLVEKLEIFIANFPRKPEFFQF